VDIARSLLRLPELFDFLVVELKVSFRHPLIVTSSEFVFI
jgi:hypothetical protein